MTLITNLDTAPVSLAPLVESPPYAQRSLASFARPANTTSYATGDVVGVASPGGVLEFPACARVDGGGGVITDVLLVIGDLPAANADFELYVFNAAPTNQIDNAAVALIDADMAKLVATFLFPTQVITGADQVAYQSSVDSEKAFVCQSDSRSLYGILVNRTAAWASPESAAPVMASLGARVD